MDRNPISLTVSEACKMSGLGKTKIYELIKSGAIASTVVTGRRLIRYDSLDRLLSGN